VVSHAPPGRALPRLVIAAPASGHGKTTVATGLMAALRRAGHDVSGHKVGPDYIDPGYHSLATGRPGRNLDPHLVGEDRLVPLLLHGASGAGRPGSDAAAPVAVIEGVMGLFDGQIGGQGFASTAHVATVTRSPVVLVVDISHASRSIAAVVQGMIAFDPAVRIGGVILNKAGSPRHADEVVSALEATGVPVLGVLQRDDGIVAPSRHLGLVPAAERDDAVRALDRLADQIAERVDLGQILALARTAPDLTEQPWAPADQVQAPPSSRRPVVAVAGGRAFTFRYTETDELLRAAGCEVVTFDPLTDRRLPDGTAGIYLGGGFPEVHAAGLAANASLLADLREAVAAGIPTVAECAGLLYLCRSVDGVPMVGVVDAEAAMTPRLTLSYRTAVLPGDQLLGPAGLRVTGHEFHRTIVTPAAGTDPSYLIDGQPVGFASATLNASYLHVHWAGHPDLAQRFADAVHSYAPRSPARSASNEREGVRGASGSERADHLISASTAEPAAATKSRAWHGDQELAPGLMDFAVNVYDGPRPDWLDEALRTGLDESHRYPDAEPARQAIARRHGRLPGEVLPTAGVAEAFALIARLRPWQRPVVVHPQFTETDEALLAAGLRPEAVLCDPAADFALDPAMVPDDADLVLVGNPTNPTGVLHPETTIRALLRPGRIVVVDEAFLDAVPGEPGSLAGASVPGLVVLRSLTKLWSIPGIRAGYLLGPSELVAELAALQSPWSVSAPAVAAMLATTTDRALAEQAARATRLTQHRAVLTDGLTELGIPHTPGVAPFVLARPGPRAHAALRAAGYAVRRADTFPGLDDSWIRIAVRAPAATRKLLSALRIEAERWS